MTTDTYTALVDGTADAVPCHCSDCDWTGPAHLTRDIEDCVLTPGDPSPVGRCPECDTLAYIDKPEPDVRQVTKVEVTGDVVAGAIAQGLVLAGVWFRCAPLGGHKFEFCVASKEAWLLPKQQDGCQHSPDWTLSELWSRQ